MLAYVFWHWPARDTDLDAYSAAQAAFHRRLAEVQPEGFTRSWSYQVSGAAWLPSGGGFEDWYLLEGSFALDPLNEAATSRQLRGDHDAAARGASGLGGLYRLRSGLPHPRPGAVCWFSKPAGMSYADLDALLGEGEVTWRRQMVLGPAPEFLFESSPAPAGVEAVQVDRRPAF